MILLMVVNHLVKVEAAKAHSIINKAMKSMTSRSESEDEVDTPKRSFISKWFGVASADETDHTVMSGESEYSSEDDYESGSSYDDESTATNEAFDRKLRAKHTKACKYMRVSTGLSRDYRYRSFPIIPVLLTTYSSV